jgi:hypothetical protein
MLFHSRKPVNRCSTRSTPITVAPQAGLGPAGGIVLLGYAPTRQLNSERLASQSASPWRLADLAQQHMLLKLFRNLQSSSWDEKGDCLRIIAMTSARRCSMTASIAGETSCGVRQNFVGERDARGCHKRDRPAATRRIAWWICGFASN